MIVGKSVRIKDYVMNILSQGHEKYALWQRRKEHTNRQNGTTDTHTLIVIVGGGAGREGFLRRQTSNVMEELFRKGCNSTWFSSALC